MKEFIITFLIGMMPIMEAKGAILYGTGVLKLSPELAFLSATIGNMLACSILIYGLDPVTKLLCKHSKKIAKLTDWVFDHTRTKHNKMMSELGHLALFAWVAAPLPGTGGWSGSLIAYVFGVKKHIALLGIQLGTLASGILVYMGVKGLIHFF